MTTDDLIPARDLEFLLYDWLDVAALCERPRYAEHGRETFEATLQTARRIAAERFLPHAAALDQNEPTFDGERVHIIPEVKEALEAFAEAGFIAASFDAEWGGLQLPYTVTQAAMALFQGANVSTSGYSLLTMAAANLLIAHGSPEQKERYVRPMLEGRFFGTMCLSEPQAGSSLADLRTTAEPQPDGTYRLRGNKMWISGGDHDLSDNIIHLVLAKIPGGPPGVKGVSLFVVPKRLLDEQGRPAERNDVAIAGLNHKMGFRGTVNTVLNLGEGEGAVGTLVGEPHRGLVYMFHMMNEARIGVGLGATALGYAGYRHSLAYAKERRQGRHAWDKDPAAEPVRIIEHADVKRMLLLQKAWVEGGLALGLYCARLYDDLETRPDGQDKEEAQLLLDLLTPIAKAWPSDWALEANKLAIQVLGGYGYSREYPVERHYRDNRLNPIHEGTNGIQALDLLGRKVAMKQGAAFRALMTRVEATAAAAAEEGLAELAEPLSAAHARAVETTMVLGAAGMSGDVARYLANASVYLDMLGHTTVAWLWVEQARVAHDKLEGGQAHSDAERAFLEGKLHTARFFMRWELPKTVAQAELLQRLDDATLQMEEGWF